MSVRHKELVKMYAELGQSKPEVKLCIDCSQIKPISEFFKNGFKRKNGTSKERNDCKECSMKRTAEYLKANRDRINARRKQRDKENPEKPINVNLKRYYGITLDDYKRMFAEQNGCCKICKKHQSEFKRRFDVDHNHRTGKVRGLLCIRCNRGIGLLRDDVVVLQTAIDYLLKGEEVEDKKPLR